MPRPARSSGPGTQTSHPTRCTSAFAPVPGRAKAPQAEQSRLDYSNSPRERVAFFLAMRTTIDSSGRIVIPKAVREQAGLDAGVEVEVRYVDGRVEIEPATTPMRLVGGTVEA